MAQVGSAPSWVLVVEKHPATLEMVQQVLEDAGHEVAPASSLPDSLALVKERLFHLVLTDLFSDGATNPLSNIQPLVKWVRPTPVAVMTAWPVSRQEAAQANINAVLSMPFEVDDLLHTVEAGLQPVLSPPAAQQYQRHLVEQFFAAINACDWEGLVALCRPMMQCLLPTTILHDQSASGAGIAAVRSYFEQRRFALPGFTIEDVLIFARPQGCAARYLVRWEDRQGLWHALSGSLRFQFQGQRISRIGI